MRKLPLKPSLSKKESIIKAPIIKQKKILTPQENLIGLFSVIFNLHALDIDIPNISKEFENYKFLDSIYRLADSCELDFNESPISCGIQEINNIGDTYKKWEQSILTLLQHEEFEKIKLSKTILNELFFLTTFASINTLIDLYSFSNNCGLFMISIPIKENRPVLINKLKKLAKGHAIVQNPNSGNMIITYLFDSSDFCTTLKSQLEEFLVKHI